MMRHVNIVILVIVLLAAIIFSTMSTGTTGAAARIGRMRWVTSSAMDSTSWLLQPDHRHSY